MVVKISPVAMAEACSGAAREEVTHLLLQRVCVALCCNYCFYSFIFAAIYMFNVIVPDDNI